MMNSRILSLIPAAILALSGCALIAAGVPAQGNQVQGWLSWRGPDQNGTSLEENLPDSVSPDGKSPSWTFALKGRGTPVIGGGRVYSIGYEGEKKELQEILVCLDEKTGRKIWEHRFTDFLTDIIYSRYGIGSPTIDPATGNVLCLSSAGLLTCFTADGKLVWQHSMMSEYGRLTFPNGRTGAPLVDGNLVIAHVITSSWGSQGPARDRLYAFDKDTGTSIWSSTPGGPPKDSSFSYPVVAEEDGRRVLYTGLGGGHLVCVDLRTGDPLWRFRMATGGVNSSALLYKNSVIAIHGRENMDNSTIGRMVALKRGAMPERGKGPLTLDRSSELWRNDLVAFTSSPVLVGNRVYETVQTGELCCVDADTGKILWHEKLAPDQIHASPAFGDGKLYVPMNNGSFFILRPSDKGVEVVQKVQLEGNCLGAPAIANGRVYVHTTDRLYSFAKAGAEPETVEIIHSAATLAPGPAVRLQVIPADLLLRQGDEVTFQVRSLDAKGLVVSSAIAGVKWSGLPTDGVTFSSDGVMRVPSQAAPTVAVIKASSNGLQGSARLRIVPDASYTDDFEAAILKPHPREKGVRFAYPRPYWVGAKLKWEIRERDGNKVLAKTLDRPLFQRTMSLIGHPDMANYTMQADIMSDGNRRSMSTGGVVNQRYLILLKGNHQTLEVSSNMELIKESVPFKWKPGTWYRLRTFVSVNADGSGTVHAKAWPRDKAEHKSWNISVKVPHVHTHGSPGLYGFSPQSRFRVYIDNVSVKKND